MNTDKLRKELEEEKAKLEHELSSVGRPNRAVPNDWEPLPSEIGMEADLADQADVFLDRENNAAILADLEVRYDTVLSALARMEKGVYGRCDVCGKTIESDRLEADPAALTCIEHR